MPFSVLILAGGIGKRIKSKKVKVLHLLMGKPIIQWVIETAKSLSPDSILIIHGKKGKEIEDLFPEVEYELQPKPLGTADAVKMGLKGIKEEKGDILILSADVPLLSQKTVKRLIEFHRDNDYEATILTFTPKNPFGYGRIIRKGNEITAIIEEKDASEEQKRISEVNGGIYIFSLPILRKTIESVNTNNVQKEYYLPDAISIIRKKGGKIGALETDTPSELQGINTRADLSRVTETLRKRKIEQLQEEGITILMPDTVYIEPQVKIDNDSIIYPNVVITGNTIIGSDCVIYPFIHLENKKIPDGSKIKSGG